MPGAEPVLALGLMSGTSRDGVDAALIRTDGDRAVAPLAATTRAYDDAFRAHLAAAVAGDADRGEVARDLTDRHADAVEQLLDQAGVRLDAVRVAGFHGHTLAHDPARGMTHQLGDGLRLAERIGIDVVADFRSADVAAGGQGAPLAPLYHRALAEQLERPLAVLNLGGVGNVTFIGRDDRVIAFDTGPGNALLDDLVRQRANGWFDCDGRLGAAGTVHEQMVAGFLTDPFFDRPPPKALDRDAFDASHADTLGLADAAATLTAFTAASVARARDHLPEAPARWLVGGGGRHNPTLMGALRERLGVPVEPVEAAGWNGDALEAEAFAYLAVRSLRGWPMSLPATTGVPAPQTGGQLFVTTRGQRQAG
ncbi:anhydro-N-acetylmuramic acid kinase [Limimonas halophila]|uniref:Anhydro-N-acetylmuramic acid kinase n=1 Tax=Limimonas halophila TaxID=1082479 RepID=A0A1G7LZH2_9PROT|nr:anhydro-N-acetylmuramic acid kinase [Limimonas halophila]SDF54359.1 anhydro-N-acetylmuramic acid kinase [Limimonas halophila]